MTDQTSPVNLRAVLAQALHPPMREGAFWAIQGTLVGLAVLHFSLDAAGALESSLLPTGSPVAILFVPVLYSSLRYGLAGSAGTALLATLLWLPDLALPDARGHPADDVINLIIVDAVAVFVGMHIERERVHQHHAEVAEKERRDAETREHAAVRSYAARLISAQEEERQRIARDIHDDPLQRVIHLARSLEPRLGEVSPNGGSNERLKTRDELLEVVGRLRDIARGLQPPGLAQLGLVAAVRGLLADVEDATDIRVNFEVTGSDGRLAPEIELGAFRIVQEAVRNVTRHASARTLVVALDYDPVALRLRVADDGVGFDVTSGALARGTQLGLLGMQERASLLGGRLVVRSVRGTGTTVVAELPASLLAIAASG